MSALFISDEQATKDIVELKYKIVQLSDDFEHNRISYPDLQAEYEILKDKVKEMNRIYQLQKTTGGKIYSKHSKWILCHIDSTSFAPKRNAPASKILSALEDAKSEIRYHNL